MVIKVSLGWFSEENHFWFGFIKAAQTAHEVFGFQINLTLT